MAILMKKYVNKRDYQKINPADRTYYTITSAEVYVYENEKRKNPSAIVKLYNDDDGTVLSFFVTLFEGYNKNEGVLRKINLNQDNALAQIVKLAEDDLNLKGVFDIGLNDLNDALMDMEEVEIEITSSKRGQWVNYSFKVEGEDD